MQFLDSKLNLLEKLLFFVQKILFLFILWTTYDFSKMVFLHLLQVYLPFVSSRLIQVNIRRWNPMSHIRSIFECLELLLTCRDSTLEEILFFVKGSPEF